jgi:hypothetical protein
MPFQDNENTKLLTYQEVVFTAMLKIVDLSTVLFQDTQSRSQVNVRNFMAAINAFESLCTRYLTKDYYDKRNLLITMSRERHDKYVAQCKLQGRTPGDETDNILEHYNTRYALLIKQLDRAGVLTEKSFVQTN